MRTRLFLLGMFVTAMAWSTEVQPSRDTDYEPLSILTRNCAGCHQKADHPGALFLNRARLSEKETLQLMIDLIETSQMPPEHKKFGQSKDGKKLLKWLKAELKKKG